MSLTAGRRRTVDDPEKHRNYVMRTSMIASLREVADLA